MLFAALSDVERRCAQVRDRADQEGAQQAAQARRTADGIVNEARSEAAETRTSAAERGRSDAQNEAHNIVTHADQAAAELRVSAEARTPALVDRILDRAGELVESAVAELS